MTRAVIVVWTKASVDSDWVHTEAAEGLRRDILFPVLLDEVKIPLEFRRLQATQLITWKGSSQHPGLTVLFDDLLSALGASARKVAKKASETGQKRKVQEKPVQRIQTQKGMVLVPKGPFLYGKNKESISIDYDYFIDIYPVSNKRYEQFIQAGGYDNEALWSKEGWDWKKKG